jgi:hypothetical protein
VAGTLYPAGFTSNGNSRTAWPHDPPPMMIAVVIVAITVMGAVVKIGAAADCEHLFWYFISL